MTIYMLHILKQRHAFTLVEMSLVLVIIALLAAGIVFGKDMIRSAEIRSFVAEKDQIVTSIMAFKLKYNCLPGDCSKATNYFGQHPQGCDPATVDKTPSTQTCNGDGDDKIELTSPNESERFLIWQHLSAAELWPNLFRGGRLSDAFYVDRTVMAPISIKKSSKYWGVHVSFPNMTIGYPGNTDIMSTHIISPATFVPDLSYNNVGTLRPAEAYALDLKYDDGWPESGNIRIMTPGIYTYKCVTLAGPDPEYDLTITEQNCDPVFNNPGF